MSGRSALGAAAAALIAVGACYTSRAPAGWLPTPQEAASHPYGAWITLVSNVDAGATEIAGELIAAEWDTLHVMLVDTMEMSRLVSVPIHSVSEVRLEFFHASRSGYATWTALGVLSTFSHGFFLVLTAPTWAGIGTYATSVYTRAPLVRTPTIEALRPYARFPQGIPRGLDRGTLRAASR